MQKDAEAHATEDKKKKDLAEVRNLAEQLIYTSEKSLKDAGDKVPADLKTSIETKVADLKKAKEGEDIELIKKVTETLSSEISKIGEILNKQASEANKAEEKSEENKEGNVRDAEFEEKDKDQK